MSTVIAVGVAFHFPSDDLIQNPIHNGPGSTVADRGLSGQDTDRASKPSVMYFPTF